MVKIHGMEAFKDRLGEAIVMGLHNMCFSDKLLFLQGRFKVNQHWDILKK